MAGAVGPTGEGAGFIDDEKGAEIAAAFRTQIQALVNPRARRCIIVRVPQPREC